MLSQVTGITGLATGLSRLGTRLSLRVASRVGAVDPPSLAKAHERVVPRLGGIGIVTGLEAAARRRNEVVERFNHAEAVRARLSPAV